MMPAAKHFDPVLGIDIHIIQPPGPVPPVPIPHPFIGMVVDPMDYVPILGATVMVGGIPRAQAGTAGKNIPSHIPIGGTFIKPPGNECEVFMGSSTVLADGDAFSHLALPALSCQDVGMPPPPRPKKKSKTKSLVLPTSVVLSIPSGVFVGGPPTISMMALGMRAGMAAAGALFKKVKGLRKGKGKKGKGKGKGKAKDNAPCGTDAHPVDVVTGGCVDEIVDYDPPGTCPFRWVRYYDSTEAPRAGPMGRGFRHPYELTLASTPGGFVYTDETGETIAFPPLPPAAEVVIGEGAVLRRVDATTFEVVEPRRRTLEFRFLRLHQPAVLVGVRQGDGRLRIGYDGNGRLLWAQDSANRLYQVDHDDAGRVSALHQRGPEPPHAVTATVLRFQYDADGCLTSLTDAFGNTAAYEYDRGRLTRMRDRRGYRFSYVYDEQGRVVHTRGEDGLWEATLEYVPEANLTIIRYADGGEWLKFYDAAGRITDVVQPDGGLLARRFDENGRPVEELDPGGHVVSFVYDRFGAHIGRRDQFGRLLLPAWEAAEPPAIDEPRVPRNAAGWEYGALIHSEHRPLGGVSARGLALVPPEVRAALQLEPRPNPAPRRELDALGRPTAALHADGTREQWQYDAEGNCVSYTDRDGATWRRRYTSWNLLAAEADPLGNLTRYEHSLRGEIVRFVDGGGAVTTYARDGLERIGSVTREQTVRESYHWNPGSCLLEKRTAAGDVLVAFELGPHGLPVRQTLASGGEHSIAYDEQGRPVLAATGQLEVTQAWDEPGRLLQDLRDGAGVQHTFGVDGILTSTLLGRFLTTYEYRSRWDFDVIDPTGGRHRVSVDPTGIARRELASGRLEVTYYGEQGRCCGKHVAGGTAGERWTRRFDYSPEGDLRAVHDDRAGVTRYSYDAAHRLTGEQRPNQPERRIRYDAAGNIVALPGLGAVGYTPGNRLALAGGERFEHDGRGHVSTRHGRGYALRYHYDSLDMLVAIERTGEAPWRWQAAYDSFGRRAWKSWHERRTEFFWDGHRLAGERDADGRLRVYVYADHDALVPLLFVDYPDDGADPATGQLRFIFANQVGVPVRVEDHEARVLWSALIAPYGQAAIGEGSTIELNLRFPGHYFDAETGLHYNRFRYYSPELGRYLQSDPIGAGGGLNVYAYPANPLAHVDVLGLTCKDPKGKTNGKAEGPPPHNKTVKLGDDVDGIAKDCGMEPQHLRNMQERCATSPNGERIIVRASNPESLKWHNKNYKGQPCVSKPVDVKAKTAKPPDKHAGLVKKSSPDEPAPKGYKWDEDGVLVKEPKGNAVHGDYDLQNVSDKNGPVNTNDPDYQRGLNEDVCPEHKQFQHGANDDYRPTKDADGNTTGIEGGDKPGRNPDPDEKYVVVEPDGTAKQIDSTKDLQQYYKDNGMDWPYPDY